MDKQAWERLLNIKTAGRDDSQFDGEHHPYEPTPYAVLERLISTGYIGKRSTLIDYGSGKGRVSLFLAHETRCRCIGVEFDERLWERSLDNQKTAVAGKRVEFIHGDAVAFKVPKEVDCCFLFNPFALHTLKRVLANIFDSVYQEPRRLRFFFYYPYEETEAFLLNHVNLTVEDIIDCRDLFDGTDRREKILVLTVDEKIFG